MKQILQIITLLLLCIHALQANTYLGTPDNYLSFIPQLQAGDTLLLEAGNYLDRLNLDDIQGTENARIVIMGEEATNDSVFLGNACCNTISLERCAWLTIQNLTIDGQNIAYIDAVKAEGTANNWAHHITLENLLIINHGGAALTVGISTKCPAWDWIIRKNTIIGAGVGMYLGNSNGEKPFVNGLIEYNFIENTLRYGIQIKHQNIGSRNIVGMVLNGKTIIRYNVISRAEGFDPETPRPNLLVGAFPASGDGEHDYYEIYGNFLWQNPNEGLFQGTGNYAFYNNILVNHHSTGWGMAINKHNDFKPRNIHVFNNTILSNSEGINFYQPDPNYEQIVAGNAIFAPSPILDALTGVAIDNIADTYANAANYVQNPSTNIDLVDMAPISGALESSNLDFSSFEIYEDSNLDFDGNEKDWSFRGAYTNAGAPLWSLALEIRDEVSGDSVSTLTNNLLSLEPFSLFPNPTKGKFEIIFTKKTNATIAILNVNGKVLIQKEVNEAHLSFDLSPYQNGIYFVRLQIGNAFLTKKIILLK